MNLTQPRALLLTLAFVTASSAYADIPHTFSAGQAASASQVNENFQALNTKVGLIPGATQYDLSAYHPDPSISSKIFSNKQTRRGTDPENPSATFTVSSCDQMTLSLPEPTTEIYTGKNSSTGDTCWQERYFYQLTGGKKLHVGMDSYNLDPSTNLLWKALSSRYQGAIEDISVINPTQSWGTSGVLEDQRFDQAGTLLETYDSLEINTYTFMGFEDVTVPAGSFSSCMKVHQDKAVPGRREMRVRWVCPGMGLVKLLRTRVFDSSSSNQSTVRELLSYQ